MRVIHIVPDLALDIVNNITMKFEVLLLTIHRNKEYNAITAYAYFTNFNHRGCKKC